MYIFKNKHYINSDDFMIQVKDVKLYCYEFLKDNNYDLSKTFKENYLGIPSEYYINKIDSIRWYPSSSYFIINEKYAIELKEYQNYLKQLKLSDIIIPYTKAIIKKFLKIN